jgi:hypothetical protein
VQKVRVRGSELIACRTLLNSGIQIIRTVLKWGTGASSSIRRQPSRRPAVSAIEVNRDA